MIFHHVENYKPFVVGQIGKNKGCQSRFLDCVQGSRRPSWLKCPRHPLPKLAACIQHSPSMELEQKYAKIAKTHPDVLSQSNHKLLLCVLRDLL